MVKTLLSFFIVIALFSNVYGGITGSVDPRVVIGWDGERPDYIPESVKNMWDTSPYRSIVRIERNGSGTGEFISPRHVLTNAHVAQDCGLNGNEYCDIYTSDNDLWWGRVAFYGMKVLKSDGTEDEDMIYGYRNRDWVILEIVRYA